jgi:hypothetical protein
MAAKEAGIGTSSLQRARESLPLSCYWKGGRWYTQWGGAVGLE